MKKKIILSFLLISIAFTFISIIFLTKKEDYLYTPTIKDIDSFIIQNDTRYIILYCSENNKYYLGKVSSYSLDDTLYDLGDTACNFGIVNKNLVISNSEQVLYSSGNYNLLPDDIYDIEAMGKLIVSYDDKNHDMQIFKRDSEAKCILKFEYYKYYIPVDLIET